MYKLEDADARERRGDSRGAAGTPGTAEIRRRLARSIDRSTIVPCYLKAPIKADALAWPYTAMYVISNLRIYRQQLYSRVYTCVNPNVGARTPLWCGSLRFLRARKRKESRGFFACRFLAANSFLRLSKGSGGDGGLRAALCVCARSSTLGPHRGFILVHGRATFDWPVTWKKEKQVR